MKINSKYPFLIPVLFVLVLWCIKFYELQNEIYFGKYGVLPRTFDGLIGIITSPLIHATDERFEHLVNNSLPLLVLGTIMFSFYKEVAFKIIGWTWILSGFWVWLAARDSYHIGASGIIYGLSSFIFFSGVFRKYYKMMALSLLVVFLYGSMIWGIFPIEEGISWEGHLFGGLAGLLLAYYYRHIGPQRKIYEWENDDEDEEYDHIPWKNDEHQNKNQINYVYKPNENKDS